MTSIGANAQYFTGPVSSSMGGGGRGGAEPELILMNPAIVAHSPTFTYDIYYMDGYLAPSEHQTSWGLQFTDNTPGIMVPGTIAYINNRRTFLNLPSAKEEYWNLSMGNFVYEHLSLGLSLYLLSQDVDNGSNHNQFNIRLGAHYNPHPEWGFGLTLGNFLGASDTIPDYLKLNPEVGLGLNYLFGKYLKLKLDVVYPKLLNPDKKVTSHWGLESMFSRYISFRFGVEKNPIADRTYVTTGFGFNGPRLNINYSIKKLTRGLGGAMHGVDFQLSF
ncbi:hypothetical protein N9W41_00425 [bacterium]|nr:hypothetical protein [bacterium]